MQCINSLLTMTIPNRRIDLTGLQCVDLGDSEGFVNPASTQFSWPYWLMG